MAYEPEDSDGFVPESVTAEAEDAQGFVPDSPATTPKSNGVAPPAPRESVAPIAAPKADAGEDADGFTPDGQTSVIPPQNGKMRPAQSQKPFDASQATPNFMEAFREAQNRPVEEQASGKFTEADAFKASNLNPGQVEAITSRVKKSLPFRVALRDIGIAAAKSQLTPDQINSLIERAKKAYPEGAAMVDMGANDFTNQLIQYYKDNPNSNMAPAMDTRRWVDDYQKTADGGFLTMGKEALHSVPGAVGGLAATSAALSLLPQDRAASLAVKAGTFAAAAAAGLAGGAVGQAIGDNVIAPLTPDALAETLGMTREQLAANERENPYWAFAGSQIPNLAVLRPARTGSMYQVAPHFFGAGVGAGMEAGIEGAESLAAGENKFDPWKIAGAGVMGALANEPNRLGRKLGLPYHAFGESDYMGVQRGEHITYDVDAIRAEFMRDVVLKPEEVFNNPLIKDTPENRAIAARTKQLLEANDVDGAAREAALLDVKKNNGLDVPTAKQYVEAELAGWKNAPNRQYHESPESSSVPAHLNAKEGTLGLFDKSTGEIHIFADQLVNESDAKAVVFHEALGHAALAWKYQEGLNNLLLSMYDNGSSAFRAAVDDWRKANPDTYSHIYNESDVSGNPEADARLKNLRKAVEIEEVLAESSEKGPLTKDLYDTVANYIKRMARAAGADKIKYSDREVRSILATAHENILNGSIRPDGTGGAPELGGIRYIYAGVRAENADLNKFNEARHYPQDTPEQRSTSKRASGWHKGADKSWRFEIDDSGFDIRPGMRAELMSNPDKAVSAEEFFRHPSLFENYPELRELKVTMKRDLWDFGQATQGWFDSKTNTINITPYAKDPRSTGIHELQHAVQQIEGFSPGGNPETAMQHVDDDVALSAAETMHEYLSAKIRPLEHKRTALEFTQNDPEYQELGRLRRESTKAFNEYRDNKGTELEEALHDIWFEHYTKLSVFARELTKKATGKTYSELPFEDRMAIGEIENFVAKPIALQNEILNKLDSEILKSQDIMRGLSFGKYSNDPGMIRDALAKIPDASYQAYLSLHGEAEARDTQNRLDLSASERAMMPPMDSVAAEVRENEYVFAPHQARAVSADPQLSREVVFARRKTRNPGYEQETEQFFDKHLSPDIANKLHGLVKNLPQSRRIPDDEVIGNALDLGLDLTGARIKGVIPDNSEYVVALSDLLNDTAEQVIRNATDLNSKGGYANEGKLLQSILDFSELATMFKESGSNVGRTLRAFKLKIGSLGEDFDGLSEAIGNFEMGDGTQLTSEEIQKMATRIMRSGKTGLIKEANRFDPNWKKYANSLFYNGLLGTASVQWSNIFGNTAAMFDSLVTDIGAAAAGSIRNRFGDPTAERLLWREVGQRYKGLFAALGNAETWKTVVREFTAPVASAHKNKWQSQSIVHLPSSLVIESGTRALQAADAFFRIVAETSNMHGLAVRQAANEAVATFGGKFGSHKEWIESRAAEIMAAPDTQLLTEVQRQADILLLQEELPQWIKNFGGIKKVPVLGQLAMPILTTTANDMRRSLERSGVPAALRLAHGSKRRTGAELDRDISRAITGLAITGLSVMGALTGDLDGLGPTDPRDRAQWLLTHKPQSINIGGHQISYKGATPFSTLFTVLADTTQTYYRNKERLARKEEDSYANLLMKGGDAFAQGAVSNSFASGLVELSQNQDNILQKLIISATGPMTRLPILSEAEVLSDPYQRDIGGNGIVDKVGARVKNLDADAWTAGGRTSLPIKIDPLGRPMLRKPDDETNPVVEEMGRLSDSTGITIISARPTTKHGRYVPSEVQNSFRMIEGPEILKVVTATMQDPRYKKMTDLQKARVLQTQVTRVRKAYGSSLDLRMLEQKPEEYRKAMLTDLQQAFVDNNLDRLLPQTPEEEE